MKPKKVVSRNVTIGLGIVCIVLAVGLVGAFSNYTSVLNQDNNKLSNLQNLLDQTQKWLNGNETLLNLTQTWLNGNETLRNQTQTFTEGPANPDQASSPPAWERTGNFAKGDVIMVELLPNSFWAQNPAAFDDVQVNATAEINIFYVDINIIDPANTMSHYEVWLTYDQQANQFSVYNVSADSFGQAVNSTVFLPNGFNFTYTFIAGTAELTGTYNANITDAGFAFDYRKNGTYLPSAFELFYARFSITQ